MKIGARNFDRSIAALSLVLLYFFYFIAMSALVVMLGRYSSQKFHVVSLCVVASLFLAVIPLWPHIREILNDERSESIDILFLISALLVSVAGGLTAASINKPNIDDSIYVPKAVFYLENPGRELNDTISWVGGLSSDPISVIFYHYEIIQASLAGFFGLNFLDLYHVAFPAIVGFLMCLTMLLVISLFDRRRWACLFGVVLVMLVICSLGETIRAYGNVSIARAFHAKFMFLVVGVPAWIYFSLRFLALNQWKAWLALLAIGIGMVGATTTAMVFLPLLSALLFASHVLSQGEPFHRNNVVSAFGYASALIPVVLMALEFRSRIQNVIYAGSEINGGFPMTFEGQLLLIIDPAYPATPIVFLTALILLLLYSEHRWFFACWIGLAIVLFLNPLVSGFVIKYLTTESIYWRLFYLLPFPTIVAVAFVPLLGHDLKSKIAGGVLLVACTGYVLWGPTSVFRSENNVTVSWPGYKIHEPELSVVRRILAAVPEGSMFAPLEISSNMVLFSSKYPQFHLRDDLLRFALRNDKVDCAYVCRSQIYAYLYESGPGDERRPLFERMLSSKQRPDLFVVLEKSSRKEQINDLLGAHGYRKRLLVDGYALYAEARD